MTDKLEELEADHPFYGHIIGYKGDGLSEYVAHDKWIWQDVLRKQYKKYCKPGTICLDVGAYTGVSVLNMHLTVPNLKLYTFEMEPRFFNTLCKNTAKYDNITPVLGAVGNRRELVHLGKTPVGGHNLGMTTLNNPIKPLVPMICLDDLLPLISPDDKISLIKLDIEGHEENAILGAKWLLTQHKPVIVIEIWERQYDQFMQGEAWEFLRKLGYLAPQKCDVQDYVIIHKDQKE
jgi:FkbM family methyltransferase